MTAVEVLLAPGSRGSNDGGWLWLRRGGLRSMCSGIVVEFWGKRERVRWWSCTQRGTFSDELIIKWWMNISLIGYQGALCTL